MCKLPLYERLRETRSIIPLFIVSGVAGLRVADAAIMPEISSGNTAVPIMMIAEKCADMIKRTYGLAEYRSYG